MSFNYVQRSILRKTIFALGTLKFYKCKILNTKQGLRNNVSLFWIVWVLYSHFLIFCDFLFKKK